MDAEEYEEWMLESITLYKDLHDFELQDPTRVIEWISDRSICVAGYNRTQKNEILQLLLPQKLHTKQNQGLCPERDLKVEHGGFSEHPVYSLNHIPETSLLVTSGPAEGSVNVWQIGAEDKDVITPINTISSEVGKETWTKIATTVAATPRVLHGSQSNNVSLTEIESTKQIYTLGFDGTVQIYDTETWDVTMKERDAVFTHKGHSVLGAGEDGSIPRTTSHIWHPWKERTVLSAATDGSFHVWDWTDYHMRQELNS